MQIATTHTQTLGILNWPHGLSLDDPPTPKDQIEIGHLHYQTTTHLMARWIVTMAWHAISWPLFKLLGRPDLISDFDDDEYTGWDNGADVLKSFIGARLKIRSQDIFLFDTDNQSDLTERQKLEELRTCSEVDLERKFHATMRQVRIALKSGDRPALDLAEGGIAMIEHLRHERQKSRAA